MTPSEFINHVYQSIPEECLDAQVSLWDKLTKESVHLAIRDFPQGHAWTEFDQEITQDSSTGKDIYFGLGLRRPNLLKSQRGKMADIRGLPGFWLDIDLDTQTGAHVAQNLPKNLDQVIEIISDYPDPTTLVDSGHGIHAYWLFEQVHPVNSGNMLDYEKSLEYFQRKIIARAQALGYHVDSTYDITRVLRLPGTINYKAGLQKPVTVLDNSGPRYGSINTRLAQCQIDLRQNLSNS